MHSPYSPFKERNPSCLTQPPPPENHAGARNPEHPNKSSLIRHLFTLNPKYKSFCKKNKRLDNTH